MRRYWLDEKPTTPYEEGEAIDLQGDVFHHIIDVCRQTAGHHFELLNGDGNAYLVRLENVGKKSAEAVVVEIRKIAAIKEPHIHVYLSVPKFQKVDLILEKLVELGVAEITPFASEFSFVRKAADKALADKYSRWQRIIEGATRQCGRGELMKLNQPISFTQILDLINRNADTAGLFAYEGEGRLTMKEALREMKAKKPREVAVIIGSEGGFSHQEVQQFQSVGLQPVTLGEQVLRVETACFALCSIIKYEFEV